MYQIIVYIPELHVESVKKALFKAGAGNIGDYDSCAWQVLGQGQFRPLEGSEPYIGQTGGVERVAEYRLELVCEEATLKAAVAAMITAHPYEEPAYSVWALFNVEEL